MKKRTKDRLISAAVGSFVVIAGLSIPFGVFMGFYTDDANWFWLCATIIIFLS